jgi:chemotaxis response regulator CheB
MKVIIVDDAMVIRQTLSAVLEADGIEVVASGPDAPTAFEAAAEYRPDVARS